MKRPYEQPTITTVDGRELMEALGPAQAVSSGICETGPSSVAPEMILTGRGGRLGRN